MSALLKDLARKAYLVIKYLQLPKESFSRSNSKSDTFENKVFVTIKLMLQGTVLKVGDVIKFGRVPFRVKESTLEKEGNVEDTLQMEPTLEKNLTDIESVDIEREINDALQDTQHL